MKKVVVTGVLVKNDKEEYLLVKKPKGVGPYAGTYLTPKLPIRKAFKST